VKIRILITGGTGMLGTALVNSLNKTNIHEVIAVGSEYDLRSEIETKILFKKHNPNYVFHLAAKVGGLMANINQNGTFFNDNVLINTNVLNQALLNSAKVCSILSTCVYPDKATYPLTEKQLHNGPPHESNFGYAYAKRMIDIQSKAYRNQHNINFICAIPNNMYGENDNFHLTDSHVVPAAIRKIYEAKINNLSSVTFWGNGTSLREFTYSYDIAEDLVWLMENYNGEFPVNIGNTEEYSIKNLVDVCKDMIGYSGEIIWDTNKPNGQYRKPTSTEYFKSLLCRQRTYTSLEIGLRKTIDWFILNYPNIRGI
jgi:GDP-L-fucose synthase